MGKNYAEKLKDPRWQRKRLWVLNRADFTCDNCGDTEQTLNVHHMFYDRNLDPWDYPDYSLHCLCETCHKEAHQLRKGLNEQIGRLFPSDVEEMTGYALALELVNYPAATIEVLTEGVACGVGKFFGVSMSAVFSVLEKGRVDGYTLEALSQSKKLKG